MTTTVPHLSDQSSYRRPPHRQPSSSSERSVAEAAEAYADGSLAFVTRIGVDEVDAIVRLGWRLEHVSDSVRPGFGGGATLFCVFVRQTLPPL